MFLYITEFAFYFEFLVQLSDFRFLDYFTNSKILRDKVVHVSAWHSCHV